MAANLPGMGMNAYFAYSVVGFRGTRTISYKAAVTAVATEGLPYPGGNDRKYKDNE